MSEGVKVSCYGPVLRTDSPHKKETSVAALSRKDVTEHFAMLKK